MSENKSNKCLIIFTRKYPYSYGETSLQDELEYHLPYYDRVIILAQDVDKDDKETRTPPEGVEYYNTAIRSRRAGRLLDKIKSPLRLFDHSQAMESDKDKIKHHPMRRAFLCVFEERCQRLIEEAEHVLNGIDLEKYDEIVLYSYWFFANVRVAIGIKNYLRMRGCHNVRTVSRAHRYDLYENRNKLDYLPMREYFLENIDRVYACSLDGRDYLRNLYPGYEDKISAGLLGTLDCGEAAMKRCTPFHIVTCCRVVPVKRLERMADTLKILGLPCRWTMIGGGVEGDDRYYDSVKKYVSETLKDSPDIEVEYTGAIPHSDIFEYYKNNPVDVFINVSSSEGIPQVIMEAASFGTPIIATDVGGTREIVLDKYNGYLIPEDFSDDLLADRIKAVMSLSDDEYFEMRRRSRETWEERFNAVTNNTAFAKEISEGK